MIPYGVYKGVAYDGAFSTGRVVAPDNHDTRPGH